jgi:hypothetical protein
MTIITLPNSAARTLALSEITHAPEEIYDEYTFSGLDIGLPADEYVVIKYFRRKVKDSKVDTLPKIKLGIVPELAMV